MSDEQKNELTGLGDAEGIELSDEALDGMAGGLIYHDPGDAKAHRQETYYVLNDGGDILMKVDSLAKAKHWAGNLHESSRVISTAEFERLRKG